MLFARFPRLVLPVWRAALPAVAARAAAYLLPVAAVVAVGLPTMILPFWSDTAIFATIGRTIAEGGFPYVDAWDQKPPSIYLIYAVAIHGPFRLIGNVRAFDLVWTAATAIVLVELGRKWWTPRAGVIAGIVYAVVYLASSTYTQLAQPDSFIGLPLATALLLHDSARGRRWPLVAAGACLGFAVQLRFIAALFVPCLPLAELAAAPRGRRVGVWLQTMLWLGLGLLLVQAVLAAYLAAGGALGEYVAATRFAAGYTRLGGPWMGAEGPNLPDYLDTLRLSFLHWALGRLVLTVPALTGAFYGAVILNERRVQRLALFVLLAYAGIAAQAKFFWYHYWLMLVPLSLLAGWTWDRIYRRVRAVQPAPRAAVVVAALAAGLLVSTPEVLDRGLLQWQHYLRHRSRPAFREQFFSFFNNYPMTREVAYHVQSRTRPGDAIYVWGYDPMIYLLADRPHASRFIYAFPLMSAWAPDSWQLGLMEELYARPPVYFIAQRNQGGPWIVGHTIDPADYIAHFPALRDWLAAGYHVEAEIGEYIIYRRR